MKVRRVRARAVYHGRFRKVNDRAPAFAFVTRGGLRYGAEMPTADRKLGVAVLGVGWCASQHIAAFLCNRHTAVTWLCAREADRAGVRTIVSFELRYNPFLGFARWLRSAGWLGDIRFARTQYLSRVTDWYSGWSWVRTRESGRSHLLAAGCHAVDALRWCSGLEPTSVSAFHTHVTDGYEWPTSIVVNMTLEGRALGHVTSSTDFMLPYSFLVELMGDRATLRQDLLLSLDVPIDLERLAAANPFPDVRLAAT